MPETESDQVDRDASTVHKKDQVGDWLLGIEQSSGKPVVVTLLISQGEISWLTSQDARQYLDPEYDPLVEQEQQAAADGTPAPRTARLRSYIG